MVSKIVKLWTHGEKAVIFKIIFWAFPQGSGFPLQSFLKQKELQKRISTTIPNASVVVVVVVVVV
ncbi:hypothetical protein, partial [Flavobacterium saliperosum]